MVGGIFHIRKCHRAGEDIPLFSSSCVHNSRLQLDLGISLPVHNDGSLVQGWSLAPRQTLLLELLVVVQLHLEVDLAGVLRIRSGGHGLKAIPQVAAFDAAHQQLRLEFLVFTVAGRLEFVAVHVLARVFVHRLDAQYSETGGAAFIAGRDGVVGAFDFVIKHPGVGEDIAAALHVAVEEVYTTVAGQIALHLCGHSRVIQIDQLIIAVDRLGEGHHNGDDISGIEIGIGTASLIFVRRDRDGLDGGRDLVHDGQRAVHEDLLGLKIFIVVLVDPVDVEIPFLREVHNVLIGTKDRHFHIEEICKLFILLCDILEQGIIGD